MRTHAKALVAITATFVLLGTSAALALQTHNPGTPVDGSQVPNGSFGSLGGVAVDQSDGSVLVVDPSGSQVDSTGAAHIFDSTGTYDSQLNGASSAAGFLALYEGSDVAIDSSGTSSDGTAYVTDSFNNLIVAFDAETGALEGAFDGDGELNGSTTPAGSFSTPCGVAVDQANGNVFLADQGNNRIWIFDSSGAYLDRIADSALNGPCGLALTSTGDLYVRNAGDGKVLRFNRTNPTTYAFASTLYAPTSEPGATDVAVNTADDHVYLDKGDRITEYDAGGSVVSTFGQGTLSGSQGIALDSASATIYASDGSTLETFGPLVTLPDAVTGTATEVEEETATLNGTLDPAGGPEASCEFQYGTTTAYGSTAPCEPAGPFSSSESVTAALSGLGPATTYHYRLRATNANGESFGTDKTFATDGPPIVSAFSVSDVGSDDATLKATINPAGAQTAWRFEYVELAEFEANGFTNADQAPDPDGSLAAGNNDLSLEETIEGLSPDTAYRFRVVATNAVDTTESAEKGFKTFATAQPPVKGKLPGQGFLPDNRAWELVSPPDKEGGAVIGNTSLSRAAIDGDAFQYASLQAFGDAIGSAFSTEYIAERSSEPDPKNNGWSTHAITPKVKSGTFVGAINAFASFYEGAFSPDLSRGVFQAWGTTGASDPNVEQMVNFYLRDDIREPGEGSYQLLTACPACSQPLSDFVGTQIRPGYAGASADFGHVVFEHGINLTTDSPPQGFLCLFLGFGCEKRLYEWDHGTLRLVGILPDGSGAVRSSPGQGALVFGNKLGLVLHPVSADGSRIVFTVGSGPGPDEIQVGELYSRINGRSTIQLNASERPIPDSPAPARYWDASADHSRVFFTSFESLTEDAPLGKNNLYMWKRADHDETQQVAVDATGGAFTLTFNGNTTAPLAFDASAATVQSALEDLVSVKVGNVSVSGGPGSAGGGTPYEVTFTGDFSGANVAEMTADGAGLSGGGASAGVATTEPVENLTYLNVDGEPADTVNDVQGVIGASEDGRYLYFAAAGQLVEGKPVLGADIGIYLWHDGAISYIGESSSPGKDAEDWYTGSPAALNINQTHVTPDGRHLFFSAKSGAGLLSANGGEDYDHGSALFRQFYVYSADTDELECASCNPSGAPATAQAEGRGKFASGASLVSSYQNASRFLSDDGRYAFFSTREALVPGDVNKRIDAYVYDTTTDKPSLLSSGESPGDSFFLDASADGADAFFITQEQLSGWDVDAAYDLYDARVGGGFPEPSTPPPSCQGDACQPAPVQLNDSTPSSSSFEGAGNPQARKGRKARRCPQGKRRVRARSGKSRCVKRHGKGNRKRATSNDRRPGR